MTSSNGSLFAPFLPPRTYELIYQGGPDVIFGGASQPLGTAEEVRAGGRLVSGRWPFSSGCQYANWIAGFCVAIADGRASPRRAGRPQIQAAWLPAHEWQIEIPGMRQALGVPEAISRLEEQMGSRREFF